MCSSCSITVRNEKCLFILCARVQDYIFIEINCTRSRIHVVHHAPNTIRRKRIHGYTYILEYSYHWCSNDDVFGSMTLCQYIIVPNVYMMCDTCESIATYMTMRIKPTQFSSNSLASNITGN